MNDRNQVVRMEFGSGVGGTRGDQADRFYRGPDRRDRLTRDAAIPVALIGQSMAVLLVVFLPVGFAFAANEGTAVATALVRVLTAVISVAAGVTCLINWRVQGFAFAGRLGATLITFGVLRAAESLLVGFGSTQASSFEPVQTFVAVSIVGLMLVRTVIGPDVDSNLSPLRFAAGGLISGLVTDGTIQFVVARRIVVDALDTSAERLVLAGTAAIWILVSVNALLTMRKRKKVPPWCALALWVFALGATLRAVEPASQVLESRLVPLLVSGLASAMMLTAAVVELHVVISAVDRGSLRLRNDLNWTHQQMRAEQAALEERLHALRNAITAVRTADATLRKFASVMEPAARAYLADALTVELGRVQCLVEPGQGEPPVDFSLAAVLQPVIAMEEACGVQLDVQLGGIEAHGRPHDLAIAVQHLLSNARRYAPGTPVQLTAEERPGRVELRVRDRGPGIPDDERVTVFARGVRGRSATGTDGEGLGLHAAARLVTGMGGQLRLEDRPGPGSCFQIDLIPAVAAISPTAGAMKDGEPAALVSAES